MVEVLVPVGGGLKLCASFETPTKGSRATVMLCAGLGQQMTSWPPSLLTGLLDGGYRIVIYDHRDVGQSSRVCVGRRSGDVVRLAARMMGLPVPPRYQLDDLATDAFGLLDALHIEGPVHVVGFSMGGMVAQIMALQHPSRMASLLSVASSPGGQWPIPDPDLRRAMRMSPDPDRAMDRAVAAECGVRRRLYGPAQPVDAATILAHVEADLARGAPSDGGAVRQLLAIASAADRRPRLPGLSIPARVVHGECDPLIPPAAGVATARAIGQGPAVLLPGVGHVLTDGEAPRLVQIVNELHDASTTTRRRP
jgi:pimeloyl-ACP methyl ester carboxylesterase